MLEGQGLIYDLQGKWLKASITYTAALTICRQLQNREGEGKLLANLGVLYGRQSRWEEAIAMFDTYLYICRERADRHGEGIAFNNLGLVYAGQGRYDTALAVWQKASSTRIVPRAICWGKVTRLTT